MDPTKTEAACDEDTVVEDDMASIGRLTIEDFLPKGVDPDDTPLPDGDSVGVDRRLLVRAVVANRVPLPMTPIDKAYLGSDPSKRSEQGIKDKIGGLLDATPMVGSIRGVCQQLLQTCVSLKPIHQAQLDRFIVLRDSRPPRIPDPALGKLEKFFRIDALRGLSTYAGLALGAAGTGVVSFLGIELAFETGALKESSLPFAQSEFGAFGFVWSFTVGAVVLTRLRLWWLEKYDPNGAVVFLDHFSKRGMGQVWLGLAALGALLGMLQTGLKPGLITAGLVLALMVLAVQVIARSCVAVEKAAEAALAAVIDKARIDNPLIAEDQAQVEAAKQRLAVIDSCHTLGSAPLDRLEKHLNQQAEDWIAYRDRLLREEAARNEADADEERIAQIEQTLLAARQRSHRSASRRNDLINTP